MNIDIQGAELLAFKGADEILGKLKVLLIPKLIEELYEDCAFQ